MAESIEDTKSDKMIKEVIFDKQQVTDRETGDRLTKSNSIDNMHFTVAKHPKESLEIMGRLRTINQLCDCVLIAEDTKFRVHKLVLAAASQYFCAMFTGGMKESKMNEITLHGVTAKALEILINFAYTSELLLTEENICYILPSALLFQMHNVVDACCFYMEHHMNVNNCISIANFSKEYGCMSVHSKASTFMQKHFVEVSLSAEFLELTAAQLVFLIRQDGLMVMCESQIYDAVVRWVAHDEEHRHNHFSSLLCAVRCQYLPAKFLNKTLKECQFLQKCENSYNYLANIFKEMNLSDNDENLGQRRKSYQPSCIFVAGGYLRQSLSNFECYCPTGNKWYKKPDLPLPRSGIGCCTLAGMFYVIGGRNNSCDGNVDCDNVTMFNPQDNTWIERAPMWVPRNRVGVAVYQGFIFAVGGSHNTDNYSSVEKYDPDCDKWTLIENMSSPRIGACVVVCKCKLFVIGGYDGTKRLDTVESYFTNTEVWTTKASMNSCRSGAGAASLHHNIYVVGGFNNSTQLNSAEMYSAIDNQWTLISSMTIPRSALAVIQLHNKIYALGGYDGTHFLTSVEMYDPEKNEWKEVANMTCGRSGHGISVGSYIAQRSYNEQDE